MFLDLDNFKVVNDSLGHEIGDLLLKKVGLRLLDCVREEDTVARLGGDEFILVLGEVQGTAGLVRAAQRVLDSLASPVEVAGHHLLVGASIGVTIFPDDGQSPVALIKNADMAMYRAKELGRNNYQLFTAAMQKEPPAASPWRPPCARAWNAGSSRSINQPKVRLGDGRVAGVEALVRWRRRGGLVLPEEFSRPLRGVGAHRAPGRVGPRGGLPASPCLAPGGPPRLDGGGQPLAPPVPPAGVAPAGGPGAGANRPLSRRPGAGDHRKHGDAERGLRGAGPGRAEPAGGPIFLDDFGTATPRSTTCAGSPQCAQGGSQLRGGTLRNQSGMAIVDAILAMAGPSRWKWWRKGWKPPPKLVFLAGAPLPLAQGHLFSPPLPAAEFGRLRDRGRAFLPLAGEGGAAGSDLTAAEEGSVR